MMPSDWPSLDPITQDLHRKAYRLGVGIAILAGVTLAAMIVFLLTLL